MRSGSTEFAHFGPSTAVTKSSATSASPKVAGSVNNDSDCVIVSTYPRKAASLFCTLEKYGGTTRVTRSVNFCSGCSAMVHATLYEPRAAAPRTRPATTKSAVALQYHATRRPRTCVLKTSDGRSAGSLGQAKACGRLRSTSSVEAVTPARLAITKLQYLAPNSTAATAATA